VLGPVFLHRSLPSADATLIVPKGDTRLAEGDVLTIFAMLDQVADVERLFQVGIDFF
jgi:trk system potassium uptake protein TrkA